MGTCTNPFNTLAALLEIASWIDESHTMTSFPRFTETLVTGITSFDQAFTRVFPQMRGLQFQTVGSGNFELNILASNEDIPTAWNDITSLMSGGATITTFRFCAPTLQIIPAWMRINVTSIQGSRTIKTVLGF